MSPFWKPESISRLLKIMRLSALLFLCMAFGDVKADIWQAKVAGFVQTPIGGKPGTSDLNRPTFKELGIESIPVVESEIRFVWGNAVFYIAAQQIQSEAEVRLAESLRTYGESIFTGARFFSAIKFNNYRFGVAVPVSITKKLTFIPKIELLILDFNYHFKTQLANKSRGYHHLTVRIGEQLFYRPNAKLALTLTHMFSVPPFNVLTVDSLHSVLLFSGLRMIKYKDFFDFEDGQALPNHLVLKMTGT